MIYAGSVTCQEMAYITYRCSIAYLKRFEDMQEQLSLSFSQNDTGTMQRALVDLESTVYGSKRGCEVW